MRSSWHFFARVILVHHLLAARFVTEFVAKIPGVGNSQSSVALTQVKYSTSLPLPEANESLKRML